MRTFPVHENLYQGTAGHYTALDAAKGWESEKSLYDGGVIAERNYQRVGHFTQMVWRDTAKLGCGEAICNDTLPAACNYDPPGNYASSCFLAHARMGCSRDGSRRSASSKLTQRHSSCSGRPSSGDTGRMMDFCVVSAR